MASLNAYVTSRESFVGRRSHHIRPTENQFSIIRLFGQARGPDPTSDGGLGGLTIDHRIRVFRSLFSLTTDHCLYGSIVQLQPEPAPDTITLRSILLGLATIAVATWYMTYFAGNLVKSYLPVAALIPFVLWVGINIGLNRFAPRFALSRIELLTIFSMMWIVGNLPAVGWGFYAVSLIPAPEFYASPENRLRDVVIPFLPDWLFLDANRPDVRAVYTGRHRGEPVPWVLWVRPFCGGLSAVSARSWPAFSAACSSSKQWQERERLVFPMSEFPVALLEGADEGRTPAVFRDKIFLDRVLVRGPA